MTAAETAFRQIFDRPVETVWASPGRVNLIGEHTDYNDGFVLPIALPHTISAAAARRDDGVLRFVSRQAADRTETHIDKLEPATMAGWAAHPAGVVWALREDGHDIDGLDLLIDGDVPLGAGLSSSAALACATALAVTHMHGVELDRPAIARLAQRAENDFAGMPCGILDQSASLLPRAGHALFLDTRTLRAEHVPLDLAAHDLELLVINTRTRHRHVDGEYADRRRTCEHAASTLGLNALRDLGSSELDAALPRLTGDRMRRRVRHVVTENDRVLDTVRLLRENALPRIGPLLTASHASLRDDYEVTVPQLDLAVETALTAGALGARMTGGGFGGCVIALVPTELADSCASAVQEAFRTHNFAEPEHYRARPSDAARQLL
ncbi:galactokinase [Saccharopolyspora erythraea]|uniref:galactokinase n=1 Tax=Saccharopolyspora erythraea TaxID=1836 RepID=UPI001BEE4E5B|nr:galactokinase [Saccharopolyspora erythraea]QUH01993.1 galactokinase [Saccharopolyspora erythraea]